MNETTTHGLDLLQKLDWSGIVEAAAAVCVAVVAMLALHTWKHQSKAQRQADFLDELTESMHKFLSFIGGPVEMVRYLKIAMRSHEPLHLGGDQKAKGAIIYIEKRGAEDAKRLFEALEACRPSVTRFRSLVAKGQVLHFKNYHLCQNASKTLTSQFDRIEALATMIAMPSLNWDNPEVIRSLENTMSIEPEDKNTCNSRMSRSCVSFLRVTSASTSKGAR